MTAHGKKLFAETVIIDQYIYIFEVEETEDGQRHLVISETQYEDDVRLTIPEDHVVSFNRALRKARRFLAQDNPSLETTRQRTQRQYPRAFQRWTEKEEESLRQGFASGVSLESLTKLLKRHPKSIHRRLKTLGLVPRTQQLWDYESQPQIHAELWTVALDNDLIDAYAEGHSIDALATRFQRDPETVRDRLQTLAVWQGRLDSIGVKGS